MADEVLAPHEGGLFPSPPLLPSTLPLVFPSCPLPFSLPFLTSSSWTRASGDALYKRTAPFLASMPKFVLFFSRIVSSNSPPSLP